MFLLYLMFKCYHKIFGKAFLSDVLQKICKCDKFANEMTVFEGIP